MATPQNDFDTRLLANYCLNILSSPPWTALFDPYVLQRIALFFDDLIASIQERYSKLLYVNSMLMQLPLSSASTKSLPGASPEQEADIDKQIDARIQCYLEVLRQLDELERELTELRCARETVAALRYVLELSGR